MKKSTVLNVEGLPLFAGIPNEIVDNFVKVLNGFVKSYSKSDYVYLSGDCIDSLCILLKGSVQMVQEDFEGEKTVIEGLQPGYVFTEKYFGQGGNNSSVSYLVASDSEILFLPRAKEQIQQELNMFPMGRMVYNMLDIMAENQARLIQRNEITSKKKIRDRVMVYLNQQEMLHHSNSFDIPFSKTDLASYLEVERAALSRELGRMKDEKIIDFDKRHFVVLKRNSKF